MSVLAMAMGGHARGGFEDNPYYHPGVLATSNAELIERLVRIGRDLGREPASPDEVRKLLVVSSRARAN
jgi:3-keto-5-aminohexanoate cleavage enzyme